eukprot:scaffold9386_cov154-Ochromonas_danica.AAC.12
MMSSVTPNAASTPPWLREEGLDDVQPLHPAASPGQPIQKTVSADLDRRANLVYYCLKIITILLCILMIVTAVVGLEYLNGVDAVEKIFVISYMLFFSTLLLAFETIELRHIEWLDHLFRRNFGFLYGPMGKAFFIIL